MIADKIKIVMVPSAIAEAISVDLDRPMGLFVGSEIHLRNFGPLGKVHFEIMGIEDREDGMPLAYVCLIDAGVDLDRDIRNWRRVKGQA